MDIHAANSSAKQPTTTIATRTEVSVPITMTPNNASIANAIPNWCLRMRSRSMSVSSARPIPFSSSVTQAVSAPERNVQPMPNSA